jgi:hypothetical protein
MKLEAVAVAVAIVRICASPKLIEGLATAMAAAD